MALLPPKHGEDLMLSQYTEPSQPDEDLPCDPHIARRCLPVPAGMTGLHVYPGRTWDCHNQNGGQRGLLQPITLGTTNDWARLMQTGDCGQKCPSILCRPSHHTGGWWTSRSVVATWGMSTQAYFYKAGDEADYDLMWDPESPEDHDAEFDGPAYLLAQNLSTAALVTHFNAQTARAIENCENRIMDYGLSQLLLGFELKAVCRTL